MAQKRIMDNVHKAVAMEKPEHLPIFICSEEADVRICGSQYDHYNSDANELARVQIEAIERFDYDWAWLQVDDCMEFEPLGVGVKGQGNILPATAEYLPVTTDSLAKLTKHGYRAEGRMQVLLDGIKVIKDYFGDTVCVCGRTAPPFSSVTLTFGITKTMMMLYDRPDFVRETMRFFIDYQTQFGLAQIEAGADAIWFGDCDASGHLISPKDYKEHAMEPARKCSDAYKEAGCVVICHNSEEEPEMVDLQADIGFSVLSVGPGIDLAEAKKIVGDRVCLSGNVDPIHVLERGTVEDVRSSVEWTIRNISANGGHVLNSGEMVPRDTPEENIQAFVETARKVWAEIS